MIGVTRNILAAATIDRPLLVHAEEILAIAFIYFFVRDARPDVLDDLRSFRNWLRRK